VTKPLVMVRLPPLVTVLLPLIVKAVFRLPLLTINSSKFVFPLIVALVAPVNSIIPLVPPL